MRLRRRSSVVIRVEEEELTLRTNMERISHVLGLS